MANGLVERFHRSLKAALMAQTEPNKWHTNLPIVLLGLRAALKKDLGYSPAELVYGTTLRLPGEFFTSGPEEPAPDPTTYTHQLRATMRELRPMLPRNQSRTAVYVSNDLHTCTHIFLRKDGAKRSLQQPYSGPHKVLSRGTKTFTIDCNGRQETVSVDRLKPAYLEGLFNTSDTSDTHSITARPTTDLCCLPLGQMTATDTIQTHSLPYGSNRHESSRFGLARYKCNRGDSRDLRAKQSAPAPSSATHTTHRKQAPRQVIWYLTPTYIPLKEA